MKKKAIILSSALYVLGLAFLAYGGPLITGSGGGGSSTSVTGTTLSGTLTTGNVVTAAGTNVVQDGGKAIGTIATETSLTGVYATAGSLSGYSTTSHNHTGVYATASSNVATASALAANGANCAAGSYPLGVDASGAAENCTTAVGVFATATSNVATATALAANGANCSAGWFPLGVDASGAVESCTQATGVFATASSVVGSASSGQFLYSANGVPAGLSALQTDGTNVTLPGQLVVSAPTTTGTVIGAGNGSYVLVTAATILSGGELVYISGESAGQAKVTVTLASTSVAMNQYPLLMLDSGATGATSLRALSKGLFMYSGTLGFSAGSLVYASTTAGSLVTTPPSATGTVQQIVGVAYTSKTVMFDPSHMMIVNQ